MKDCLKELVLVVEDEASARDALVEVLRDEGYLVETASNGQLGLDKVCDLKPHVVLTDLKMPGIDGIELIRRGREASPHSAFMVMTAFGKVETAVEAIRAGAENYLTKPLDLDAALALLQRAAEKSRLAREAASLRSRVVYGEPIEGMVGAHPAMLHLTDTIRQVAPSRATVLIEGASGTGKELVAAAIHRGSPRKDRPFVRLNCAALAETLLESELFGHERGAFTGALARRIGRFEQANGGTVFLDEVSEIPLGLQVKLLRLLQEQTFERVGGNQTLHVDVRLIAATNRNLKQRVKEGKFREDLFYRLNVVQIQVPPLCARRSDIPLLAGHFLDKFNRENGRNIGGFTDEALTAMTKYGWPGNVRELENAIERAVVLCEGDQIGAELLPQVDVQGLSDLVLPGGVTLAEAQRLLVAHTLEAVGGSVPEAAEILQVSEERVERAMVERASGGAEPPQA